MAIKAIVDKLEEVEEPFRGLYTEVNGKWEITGVEDVLGLSAVKALRTENGARRISEKTAKDALAMFAPLNALGKKPEEIIALLDRIPELELAAEGKIDDKKLDELVAKRLDAKTGPLSRQITTLTTQLGDATKIIDGFKVEKKTRTIHDAIREAVGKAQGFVSAAIEDALVFGERMLDVNEEGKVVTKDGVGVTPGIDAVVWLTEMQNKKPHWWGTTQGGGAGGNNGKGGGGGGTNPWTDAAWNMTEQAAIFRANPERAKQLAQSAGTKIGGSRPAKK